MKNVTVSMDEKLLREVRLEAAKAGTSVSKYIASILERDLRKQWPQTPKTKAEQLAALERVLSGPKWDVLRDGRVPTREERNER